MSNSNISMQDMAGQIQKEYQAVLNYKSAMNFPKKWEVYEKFKAGDQWAPKTDATKNLPRPVFNIISYIENHKICTVLQSTLKAIFQSPEIDNDNSKQQADLFTQFSEYTWDDLDQDKLNEEVMESASNLGTGLVHYYFDNNVKGGNDTQYVGKLKGEFIDPINFFPGNPQQIDIQKQPFIIISKRDLLSVIKEIAKNNNISDIDMQNIKSDSETENEAYTTAKQEVQGIDKATVLTKYYKQNGTVWFTQVCGTVVIKQPTDTRKTLYPIAIMQWYKRKKSIFGIGDTEGIIPNQKMINLLYAMQMLSIQLTGFPKIVKNSTFVRQKITNTIGEVIENSDPQGNNNHINYLQPPAMSTQAQNIVDSTMENTKILLGATETSTGELGAGSQMNATAINLLQQAAAVPIDGIRKRYYRFIRDCARIWEEFFKQNYNTERAFTVKDKMGNPISKKFIGTDAEDLEFNLKIDVIQDTPYAESNVMTTLNNLLNTKQITLQQYLTYAPKDQIPFKNSLLKDLEQQQQAVIQPQPPQDDTQQGVNMDNVMKGLTPEEQQMAQKHPELLQQIQGMQQQGQDISQEKVMGQLSPREQAILQAHPELLKIVSK